MGLLTPMDPHCWQAKLSACAWAWARFSFWPVFLVHELVILPRRIVIDEPAWERDAPAAAQKSHATVSGLPLLQSHFQSAIDTVLEPSGNIILRRFEHSWRRSWLLLWNSVVFYAAVAALEFFGLDALVAAFKPEITHALSAVAGLFWRRAPVAPGTPVSIINLADPRFSLPCDAKAFPFSTSTSSKVSNGTSNQPNGSGDGHPKHNGSITNGSTPDCSHHSHTANGGRTGDSHGAALSGSSPLHRQVSGGCRVSLGDAHLLSMCAKLVYEEPARIRAVAHMWGVQFRAWRCVPSHAAGACGYVPDVIWMALTMPKAAVIVAFRGADPFTQVSRRADVPTMLAQRPGMGGVLLGFYRAFFHQCDPGDAPATLNSSPSGALAAAAASGIPRCEYDVLEQKLQGLMTDGRKLYLTGHSIGAGLAAIFAQALHARGSPLATRVGGVVTFGQPRWGDAVAAQLFEEHFGDRCLRITHASDMIPEIPTAYVGYQHAGPWVHITSEALGPKGAARLISETEQPEALAAAVAAEDVSSLLLALKRLATAVHKADWPLVACRAGTLLLPGIGDHFPWDYEAALRDTLLQGAQHQEQ